MNNFLLLLKKEVWENWVNSKMVIAFSIFAVLAIFLPFSQFDSYYNRIIVQSMPATDLLQVFYPTLGTFILILVPFIVMGAVASEVKSTTTASLLVKPVGRAGYVLSKYLIYLMIFGMSTTIAVLIGAIYANSLALEPNAFDKIWAIIGLYWAFIAFAVSLVLFLSTITKSQVLAGTLGFLLLMIAFMLSGTPLDAFVEFLPTRLILWIQNMYTVYPEDSDMFVSGYGFIRYAPSWSAFWTALVSSVVFVLASIGIIRHKEL